MIRIAGINIPEQKQIEVALTYIFGIGLFSSREILKEAGVNPVERASKLKPEEVNKLREIIENKYKTEGDLRRNIILNIKRLKDINSYKGLRSSKGLPVRGQRTKTNSRTVRGNVRKTVGSGKKSADAK
ncbi:MAG: 30S ribosomal protein S13 [Patescibacteria group bacterium]|nr:30S ribosomal protein S13 [Patescibacteria group bacterium]